MRNWCPAVAFEIEHCVDHVLEHTGPGDGALLGHVSDQARGRSRAFWQAGSARSWTARTWLTLPGALSTVSSHMVWIESMTTRQTSALGLERGCNVAQR